MTILEVLASVFVGSNKTERVSMQNVDTIRTRKDPKAGFDEPFSAPPDKSWFLTPKKQVTRVY